jgi:TatA/E family protein of Tat protein translocase
MVCRPVVGEINPAAGRQNNGRHSMLLGGFVEGLLQPTHPIFIFAIVLLIFGPKKIPDLGHALGKGIREFKDAIRGGDVRPDVEK